MTSRADTTPPRAAAELDAWLRENDITRTAFADALEVHRQLVQRWLSGMNKPALETAVVLEQLTDGAVSVSAWEYPPPPDERAARMRAAELRRALGLPAASRAL